jgi:pseudaminic acid cytidylyltransferase
MFNGLPVIAWPIKAAIASRCFDRIIVSTDCGQIAEVALEFGAEVPFVRPQNLSDDCCPTVPVISHAIDWLNRRGFATTEVCCIYAPSPFIEGMDIQKGLQTLLRTESDYVVSATRFNSPIQRAFRITDDEKIEMLQPETVNTRSQDLEATWHDAGQFYWGRADAWLDLKPILIGNAAPLVLPSYRVHDIDTEEDWLRAELFHQALALRA